MASYSSFFGPRTSPGACKAIVQAFQPSQGPVAGPNKDILRLMYAMVDRNDTMVAELRSHNVPKRLLAWLLSAAEDEDELESIETALQVNKRIEGNQKCRAGLAYYLARDRACRRLVYLPLHPYTRSIGKNNKNIS